MADDDIIAELDKLKAQKVVSEKTAQIYLSQVRDFTAQEVAVEPPASQPWSKGRLTWLGIGIVLLSLAVGVLIVHK